MINETLNEIIKQAIKSGDQPLLRTARLVKTEFTNFLTAKNAKPLTTQAECQIINKLIANHKEVIAAYENVGKLNLAESEKEELSILEDMLPKMPTTEEIENAIKESGIEPILKNTKFIIAFVSSKYPSVTAKDIINIMNKH
jgi:hypothetical protein